MVGKTEYATGSHQLGDFLSGDSQTSLRIPHYQRGYAWKNEHVSDFMDDLLEQIPCPDQYYFGTMTTIDSGGSQGITQFELIDGQQRITTAIILLVSIRDIFYELNSTLKDEVEKEIFNMDVDKTKSEHYKLILDDDDDMFFRDSILNKVSKDKIAELKTTRTELETHVNLRESYLKIRQVLDENLKDKKTEKEKTDFLNSLRSTLRKKFIISNLDVNNPNKAYTLFNRMNDRGLKLAPADLAKDLILSHVDGEARLGIGIMTRDDGIKKWRELEIKTKKKKGKMNNYIHHYLVAFHSKDPKKTKDPFVFHANSKTFDDLEAIIKQKILTGGALLQDLSIKFDNYDAIRKAPQTSHPKISAECKEILGWVNELGILIIYPVLMAGLEKYTKDDFTKLCDVLLKWFFRVKSVANKNASALEVELAQVAYEILHNNLSFDDVKNKLVNSQYNISDNVFESYLHEISLGNTMARYILIKIVEEQQHKKITDVVPSNKITVEHIMPQNGIEKKSSVSKLKSDGTAETDTSGNEIKENFIWIDYIKKNNNISDTRDAKSFHQNFRNKLGNITIVDKQKNSFLGVNPFSHKCYAGKDKSGVEKGCFKNSQILLNQEITKFPKWSKLEIESRQKSLASIAKDIWKI